MDNKNKDFQNKDKYNFVSEKPRKKIFVDNLIGGLAWGVGSVLGATIIVGLLGFFIARSRQIPLVGDVVQVVLNEIQQGRNSDIFNNGNNNRNSSQQETSDNPTPEQLVSSPQ